eukprot:4792818-Amphidinium_carterae.2
MHWPWYVTHMLTVLSALLGCIIQVMLYVLSLTNVQASEKPSHFSGWVSTHSASLVPSCCGDASLQLTQRSDTV